MAFDPPDRYNLVDHFVDRHVRDGRGGRLAISCGARNLTYSQIAEQVNRAGKRFA